MWLVPIPVPRPVLCLQMPPITDSTSPRTASAIRCGSFVVKFDPERRQAWKQTGRLEPERLNK